MSDLTHQDRSFERRHGRVSFVTVLEGLCGSLVAIIVFLVFSQVVARYVVNVSLAWSEEATRLLFIYLCFFGFVVAVQTGRNLRLDLLVDRMPAGFGRWVRVLVHLTAAVFLAVVTWQGILMVRQVAGQLAPALQISKSFFYAPIPTASALLLYHVAAKIVSLCRRG